MTKAVIYTITHGKCSYTFVAVINTFTHGKCSYTFVAVIYTFTRGECSYTFVHGCLCSRCLPDMDVSLHVCLALSEHGFEGPAHGVPIIQH